MNKTKKAKTTESIMVFVEENAPKAKELKYEVPGHDTIVVTVKPVLPFKVRSQIVRLIGTIVFLNDGNKFEDYSPENLEFAERYAVITYFTDFKLPSDINDAWLVLYNTPLYDDVMDIVGKDALDLFGAAESLISAKLDYLAKKSPFDGIASVLENKLNDFKMDFSQEDMQSMLEVFKKLPSLSTDDIVGAVVKAQEDKDNENK